jgi:Uma2 family endonuclease
MNDADPLSFDALHVPPLGEPVWEIATLFPEQGDWSEEEYLALDTNRLIEFTDGRLEFLPMPTGYHQLIVKLLVARLDEFIAKRSRGKSRGKVLFAPIPVRLWAGKYREPDVMYFKPGRYKDLRRPPKGADLVMEITSPGDENRERDFRIKRGEYAAAGIAEYWIVDPEERTITVLTLSGKRYRQHGKFAVGSEATSVLLPGFAVTVANVFAVDQDGNHVAE